MDFSCVFDYYLTSNVNITNYMLSDIYVKIYEKYKNNKIIYNIHNIKSINEYDSHPLNNDNGILIDKSIYEGPVYSLMFERILNIKNIYTNKQYNDVKNIRSNEQLQIFIPADTNIEILSKVSQQAQLNTDNLSTVYEEINDIIKLCFIDNFICTKHKKGKKRPNKNYITFNKYGNIINESDNESDNESNNESDNKPKSKCIYIDDDFIIEYET